MHYDLAAASPRLLARRPHRALIPVLMITVVAVGANCRQSFSVCVRNDECGARASCINGTCVASPDALEAGLDAPKADAVPLGDAAQDRIVPRIDSSAQDTPFSRDTAPGETDNRDSASSDAALPPDVRSPDTAAGDAGLVDAGRDLAPADVPGDATPDAAPDGVPRGFPNLTHCGSTYQHNEAICDPINGTQSWMISGLAYSRDAHLLASAGDDGRVMLWAVRSTELARIGTFLDIQGRSFLTFSPSGNLLAVGAENGRVSVWDLSDLADKKLVTSHSLHSARILQLAFSADGNRLLSLDDVGKFLVFSVSGSPSLRSPRSISGSSGSMAVDPRGTISSQWVAFGMTGGTVQLVDVMADTWSPMTIAINQSASPVVGLAFSPDGTVLATGSDNGQVTLIDATNKTAAVPFASPPLVSSEGAANYERLESPWELAFTTDGTHVFAASGGSDYWVGGTVRNYEVAGGLVDELTPPLPPFRMAVAPDDSSLVIGYNVCGKIQLCTRAPREE